MLIVCPNCAKSYHIARSTLGTDGRPVQCSKCFSRWHCTEPQLEPQRQQGAAGAPAAEFSGTVPDTTIPGGARRGFRADAAAGAIEGAAAARHARGSYDSLYGAPHGAARRGAARPARHWPPFLQCCAAILLVCAGMAAVGARAMIVEHAPALAVLYQGIGLPVNTRGIAITDVKSAMAADGATPVLSVEGKLTNLRGASVSVPEIVASLQGTDGRALYSWTSQAPKSTLAPGETASFRTRLAAPPNGGQTVMLRFASAADSPLSAGKTGR